MNVKISPKKLKLYATGSILGLGLVFVLSLTFYDLDSVSLWLLILIPPVALLTEKRSREREREKTLLAFRDGLSYVKNALDAGDSAENAFGAAVLPLKKLYGSQAPVTGGFAEICRKVQNGMPLEKAVLEFANRSGVQDIIDFGDVFSVLKRSGGDMNVFLAHEVKNITDKMNLKREINVVIAGKRNEYYIMCLIPVAMILYLKVFSADMMAALYHNFKGISFMTSMIFLYALCVLGGQWILRKHLKQK